MTLNSQRLKGDMLPCILLHATACQLREFTLDLLHAKFISSSITIDFVFEFRNKGSCLVGNDGQIEVINRTLSIVLTTVLAKNLKMCSHWSWRSWATIDRDGATYKFCMEKVQRKFTELTGGGMK